MKVSEQHLSVEWSEESDVMASAAAETQSTEVLAASATEGVSVVMATAAMSLLTGVLSLSVERLGTSGVMEAAGSENLRDPSAMAASPLTEMALSLSSVGMGVMTATGAVAVLPLTEMALSLSSLGMSVLVVMTAIGAVAVLPLTEMALSLSSLGMGVLVVMAAAGSESPGDPAVRASSPPNDGVLSLSSETMVVPAAVASAVGATLLLTDAMLSSLSSETAAVA